ncbi:alpha/beta hydrolase domain-containing protein [Obba rivulosa]|uniref:Alpha/beta hydrolase domain-containing protein n=1 Tax=Obba rivulosa TaxID=1052685 RepID=A0A8E2AQ01_9APHY|nr:alpha/beta hydrolase domain-containing protein [Obba rivulosa]
MDFVASQQDVDDIPLILKPTRMAFVPLLEERRREIESIRCETYQYGPTDRHKLDIYYPPSDSVKREKAPVLIFAYGGGFGTGERLYRPPIDLIYRNVGAFFAKRGIVFVIPDYRLVPDAIFPQPAEDLRDAVRWVIDRAEDASNPVPLDTANVFLLGHCTGANLIVTMLLLRGLLPPDIRSRIRGVALMGGLYHISEGSTSVNHAVIAHYYGDRQQLRSRTPLALLDQASKDPQQELPAILVLVSEREPEDIMQSNTRFIFRLGRRHTEVCSGHQHEEVCSGLRHEDVQLFEMDGHNHISPELTLWTGQGEEWAIRVLDWIEAQCGSE